MSFIEVDPASREFSISSLIAFDGRWMIYSVNSCLEIWRGLASAAAIWLTTSLLSFLIGLGPSGSYSASMTAAVIASSRVS